MTVFRDVRSAMSGPTDSFESSLRGAVDGHGADARGFGREPGPPSLAARGCISLQV